MAYTMFNKLRPTNIGTGFPGWDDQQNKNDNPWKPDPWGAKPLINRESNVAGEFEPQPKPPSFSENLRQQYDPPNNEAMTAYKEYLAGGAPKREDYKRSGWAKAAAAGLAGLGAVNGDPNAVGKADAALNAPYDRATEDWQQQGAILGESARVGESEYEKYNKRFDADRNWSNVETNNILNRDKFEQDQRRDTVNAIKYNKSSITGEIEAFNPLTGQTTSIGQYDPSYAEANSEWNRRTMVDANIAQDSQQRGFNNAQFGREWTQQNPPVPGIDRIDAGEQGQLRTNAERELAGQTRYASLFNSIDTGNGVMETVIAPPEQTNAGLLSSSNEKEIADWTRLYGEFQQEVERLIEANKNRYTQGRFIRQPGIGGGEY